MYLRYIKIFVILFVCFVCTFFAFNVFRVSASTIYWYNNATDAQWTTVGNWYTDIDHSSPLGSLPTANDAVITVAGAPGPQVNLDAWVQPASIDATATGITFTSASDQNLGINIIGATIFNGSSHNYGVTINGDTTFNGTSTNYYGHIIGTAVFNNSSFNNGGVITGNATFNGTSYNAGTINGNATFNTTHYGPLPTGGVFTFDNDGWWGHVTGTVFGSDNAPATEYFFNGLNYSKGVLNGNATFNGSSKNYYFDGESNVAGTVNGNAIFNGDLSENGVGVVTGIKTRYYTTAVSPTRDFITDGSWTVVADDAKVDVAGATYDSNTVFKVTNCGSFIPSSIKPVVFGNSCRSEHRGTSGGSSASSRIASLINLGDIASAQELARQYPDMLANLSPDILQKLNLNSNIVLPPTPQNSNANNNNQNANQNISNNTNLKFKIGLELGDIKEEVRVLQVFLNNHGFILVLDGSGSPGHETNKFGAFTKLAVQMFQKAYGLVPDGIVGENTLRVLNSL